MKTLPDHRREIFGELLQAGAPPEIAGAFLAGATIFGHLGPGGSLWWIDHRRRYLWQTALHPSLNLAPFSNPQHAPQTTRPDHDHHRQDPPHEEPTIRPRRDAESR